MGVDNSLSLKTEEDPPSLTQTEASSPESGSPVLKHPRHKLPPKPPNSAPIAARTIPSGEVRRRRSVSNLQRRRSDSASGSSKDDTKLILSPAASPSWIPRSSSFNWDLTPMALSGRESVASTKSSTDKTDENDLENIIRDGTYEKAPWALGSKPL